MVARVDSGTGVSTRGTVIRPTSPKKAAPAAPVYHAPAYTPPSSSGGGGGNSSSVGSFTTTRVVPAAAPAAAVPAAPVIPKVDPNAYKSDASYIAQLAALNAARQNYETDDTNKISQYNTQYADALKNLGWSGAAKGAVDDPTTAGIDESKGSWNLNDLNTASGRGYTNQKNDYAARGLLQSSLYSQAIDNLMRSLNDQNTSLTNSKTSYLGGLSTDKAQFEAQNTYQQEQAKQDAMQRVLAGLLGSS